MINKNKIILFFATVLLVVITIFMIYDLFFPKKEKTNNYKFDIEKYKQIDTSKLCFKLSREIPLNFDTISSICTSTKDQIYIGGNKFIAIFDSIGKMVSKVKTAGNIIALAVNSEENLFAVYKNSIEIYTQEGKVLQKISNFSKKSHFTSIVLEEEFFFIADAGKKVIYKLDYKGNTLQEIGKKDENFKGFIIPSPYFDIIKGQKGQLWAVNTGRHEFTAFSEQGEAISSWKKSSMSLEGFSGCCNPSHIAMLSNGDFVTSEKGTERIKIHSQNGDFKCLVAGSNLFEKGTKGIDLAVDSKDRIFALDPKRKKILIFEK